MGRISKIQKPATLSHDADSTVSFGYILCLLLFVVYGCAPANTIKVDSKEQIEVEQVQLQESNLLDVGILVFDGGEVSEQQKEDEGISEEIRQAEARYISYHLRETMQKTSGWGSINVLPSESEIADVIVQGEIIESTGEKLQLKVAVKDSTGTEWFENTYFTKVTRQDYTRLESNEDLSEVYQGMYNRIANDIYRYRKKIDDKQLATIRNTSELKYAAALAPEIYNSYVTGNAAGEYTIVRLPAIDDPSLLRVRKIREREFLLVDTINEHYGSYYDQVHDTYGNWRKYYLYETLQKRKVEREAKLKKTLGAAAVVGTILMALLGEGGPSPAMVAAGVALYQEGSHAAEEAVIHKEAIVELSESLQADAAPLVVEVDGEALELTGTLDEQYIQWRTLLQEIYEQDIGLPAEADDETFNDA